MRQTRRSLFETNSSSTHSVAIHGAQNPPKYECTLGAYVDPADHYIHMKFGEFGWGYDEYEDDYTKLQYLLTMIAETARRDGWHPKYTTNEEFYMLDDFLLLESTICEHVEGCKGICLADEITSTAIDSKNEEGENYVLVDYDGYIDHQSYEDYRCLADFLEDWDTTIEDFVFNQDVVLVIDNDNG